MGVYEANNDSNGEKERKSEDSCDDSGELVDKGVFFHMFILDLDDRYFLFHFFLLLFGFDLCVDVRRQEEGCSFGEEDEVGVF